MGRVGHLPAQSAEDPTRTTHSDVAAAMPASPYMYAATLAAVSAVAPGSPAPFFKLGVVGQLVMMGLSFSSYRQARVEGEALPGCKASECWVLALRCDHADVCIGVFGVRDRVGGGKDVVRGYKGRVRQRAMIHRPLFLSVQWWRWRLC